MLKSPRFFDIGRSPQRVALAAETGEIVLTSARSGSHHPTPSYVLTTQLSHGRISTLTFTAGSAESKN